MFTDVFTQTPDLKPRNFVGQLVHLDGVPTFMFDVQGGEAVIELPMTQGDMLALAKGAVIDFGICNGVEVVVHGLHIH